MKKLTAAMMASTLLTACASTPSAPKFDAPAVAIHPIKLNLTQKFNNPTFYSQNELATYLNECLKQSLANKGKLSDAADAPTLNIELNYKRVFSGEAFGMQKSLGAVHFDYQYQITQNGQPLHQGAQVEKIAHTGLVGVFTLWQLDHAKAAEDKYLNSVCNDIVEKIY